MCKFLSNLADWYYQPMDLLDHAKGKQQVASMGRLKGERAAQDTPITKFTSNVCII